MTVATFKNTIKLKNPCKILSPVAAAKMKAGTNVEVNDSYTRTTIKKDQQIIKPTKK